MFYIEEYTNMAINYLKLMDRDADMDITSITIKECSNEQLLERYRTELEKEIEYDLLDEFNEYTIDVAVHVKEN